MRVRRGMLTMLILLAGYATATAMQDQDPVQELERRLEADKTAPAQDAPVPGIGELPAPHRLEAPNPAAGAMPMPMPRPSLGVSVVDISELTRRRFGITVDHGAVISQVRPGYPAARAGLPLGGVIVAVNGQRIGSAEELVNVIQAFRPGEEIEVTYYEGDRIGRKKLRLIPMLVPAPLPERDGMVRRLDPPLRLGGRQPGERPILDALERALDSFAPAPSEAAPGAGINAPIPDAPAPPLPPPPPPPPPPGKARANEPPAAADAELPPPPSTVPPVAAPPALEAPAAPAAAADNELRELRREVETLRQQLEQLLRRLEELERKG